ncbi:MAG: nucleoside phosphorylase [Bacteroidales bacterium]|nr:nucleoside phosphorylase [Bacteroidales bacterium]
MTQPIKDSELIINPDGSVYHLHLRPENVAPLIIVVGDQDRVKSISKHFQNIEIKAQNREFVTHTGTFNNKRLTVLSTGIGTDNIDIVINELDAAVNIDLETRLPKSEHTSLQIVRLGTSGALQPDIEVNSFVASRYGLGFDGLLNFYRDCNLVCEHEITEAFMKHTSWNKHLAYPYVVKSSDELIKKICFDMKQGITATAPGFYAPQGRQLRLPLAFPDLNEKVENFEFKGNRITNFEMETSALYGLGALLGHQTLTVCDIIANRVNKTYSKDYKKSVETLIEIVLERLTS